MCWTTASDVQWHFSASINLDPIKSSLELNTFAFWGGATTDLDKTLLGSHLLGDLGTSGALTLFVVTSNTDSILLLCEN
eukprot:13019903-Ditylum_brightwellii.AAC.1